MGKKREEFNSSSKWNTKDLFVSDNECLKEIKNTEKKIKEIKKYQGIILENENNLQEILDLDVELSRIIERIYIYAHINYDADTTNSKYQELYGLARNLYTMYLDKTSYIVPEILAGDYSLITIFLKKNKNLKKYRRMLKEIFRTKKHILSSDIENVVSNLSKVISSFDEIMGSLTDSDFKFDSLIVNGKELELTESNFSLCLKDNNRDVRKQAFDNIYKKYAEFKNTLATILKSEIDSNVIMAKIRKYSSSLEASLFKNEINKKVYFNLIKAVHNNLEPLYKYFELKRKMLNLDELHIYDTYTELNDENNREYSFEEAQDLILKVVSPLGEAYKNDLKQAFNNSWIDYCNNEGKRGGAYCTACYDVHPYVLMSYEKSINDVSTLAHELGHAMHYYYASQNQSYMDYNYSIFVAEVASQVNEILLSRYLLDNTDDKNEKMKLIDDLLQKYKSTIYRQTMFAEFELFLHDYTANGQVLTSEVMCNKYYELNKLYFGDKVFVDDAIKYEWERIPHFYMNFYVYQYATGFTAAVNIANEIYEGNNEVRDNYLKFLQLGCTKNPIDSLKVVGIDMNKDESFNKAINYMNDLISEFASLQGSDKNE